MNWIDGMNRAMDYIEEHLDGQIEIAELARIAVCSEFHFQRMFAFILGFTVNDYIRKRRLSAAAFDLMNGDKVIDVALKYGYESPTAFTRAFRSVHGVSPNAVKKEGISVNTFPKLAFTFSVKGEEAMNFKIVTKKSFRIVGYKSTEPMTMENCFEIVPKIWKKVEADNGIEKLLNLADGGEPKGILGISTCEGGDYDAYYIAVATSKPAPEGMSEYIMPQTTYAVFEAIGAMPDAIQKLQQRIVSEWLPASGYEYAPAPDIEVYPEGDQYSEDYRSEVWLPIVKASGN